MFHLLEKDLNLPAVSVMIQNVLAVRRRVGADKSAKCLFNAETVLRVSDKHDNIINLVEISSIAVYPIFLLITRCNEAKIIF